MGEAFRFQLPFLLFLPCFLTPASGISQSQPAPVTYSYQQFLNTARADLSSLIPFANPAGFSGLTEFRYQTLVNKNNQHQIRDEITASVLLRHPVLDSAGIQTDLKTLSVFLDQEKVFSRSLEWSGTAGLYYRNSSSLTSASAGIWLTEQKKQQSAGPAADLRHQSEELLTEWAQSRLDLAWFAGSAGKRELDRRNFTVTVQDPGQTFYSLSWQRYQLSRDYLAGTVSGDSQLDYRDEASDRISLRLISPELLSVFQAELQSSWADRTVKRRSDLAGILNPNYQVRSGSAENELALAARFGDWQFRIPVAVSSGTEDYSVLETRGLTGSNEDIQNDKLRKRNLETRMTRISPSLRWTAGRWTTGTGALISKNQLFNPENNRYDDFDTGTLGLMQEITYTRSARSVFAAEAGYQQIHQVFIHRDRSGDNYKNYLIRLAGHWREQFTDDGYHSLRIQISSQLRAFDYDDRFTAKKSFSFRVLTVEDSLSGSLFRQIWFFRLRTGETSQGTYFPGRQTELPVRHLSYYLAEPGLTFGRTLLSLSWRLVSQDQFVWTRGDWKFQQNIRQSGPVIQSALTTAWMEFTGDIWLMSRKMTGEKSGFLPSLTLSCRYRW